VAATAALLPLATHALLPRHWWWRCKKGLVSGNSFADGLLFEIVSSLGYFCLNRRVDILEITAVKEDFLR
jgi:hypothetical protein